MNDKPFEEKIKALKKLHSRSHPDALSMIDSWEEKFARLKATSEWLTHPNTQELLRLATEQISAIEAILSDKEDLGEVERKSLFAQKRAHLVYVATLSANPQSEMQSIESSVDSELNTNDYE